MSRVRVYVGGRLFPAARGACAADPMRDRARSIGRVTALLGLAAVLSLTACAALVVSAPARALVGDPPPGMGMVQAVHEMTPQEIWDDLYAAQSGAQTFDGNVEVNVAGTETPVTEIPQVAERIPDSTTLVQDAESGIEDALVKGITRPTSGSGLLGDALKAVGWVLVGAAGFDLGLHIGSDIASLFLPLHVDSPELSNLPSGTLTYWDESGSDPAAWRLRVSPNSGWCSGTWSTFGITAGTWARGSDCGPGVALYNYGPIQLTGSGTETVPITCGPTAAFEIDGIGTCFTYWVHNDQVPATPTGPITSWNGQTAPDGVLTVPDAPSSDDTDAAKDALIPPSAKGAGDLTDPQLGGTIRIATTEWPDHPWPPDPLNGNITWAAASPTETYDQYVARLRSHGWLGTAIKVTLDENNGDPEFIAGGVPCTSAATGSSIGASDAVRIFVNPSAFGEGDPTPGLPACPGRLATSKTSNKCTFKGNRWADVIEANESFYAGVCNDAWTYFWNNQELFASDGSITGIRDLDFFDIVEGEEIGDGDVINQLSAQDPDMSHWAKTKTIVFGGPHPFEIHFYRHIPSNTVRFDVDFKIRFMEIFSP